MKPSISSVLALSFPLVALACSARETSTMSSAAASSAPTPSSAAVASETARATATATAIGAADVSPTLSASAPPSASARASRIDPRAAQIANELNQLDVQMLGVLNSANGGRDNVLRNGLLDGPNGLESDLSSKAPGGLNLGGGTLRQGGGSAPGLAAIGRDQPTIHKKPITQVRVEDVRAALEEAGCKVTPHEHTKAGQALDAACPEKHLVTFFAVGVAGPDPATDAGLAKDSAISRDGGALLFIHPEDTADLEKARALLRRVTDQSPRATVGVGGSSVMGGTIANASAVVAGMAAGFRRCYQKALNDDPSVKGTLKIIATVGPKGEVTSATSEDSGALPAPLVSCIKARVSAAQFAAPVGDSVTVRIPIAFAAE